jgi:single-strand DNA-binding protein
MSLKPLVLFDKVGICTDLKNVGKDPQKPVVPARIAVNLKYKDKNGDEHKTTSFFSVVFYGRNAENILKYGKKGSIIDIRGEPVEKVYETKSGEKRSSVEFRVEFFSLSHTAPKPADHNTPANDDDIPFQDETDVPF